MYRQLAAAAKPKAKGALLLNAGRAFAKADKPRTALEALSSIPAGSLTDGETTRRALLAARLDLATGRPKAALDALAKLNGQRGGTVANRVQALKGSAYFALNQPVAALGQLTRRDSNLDTARARTLNRQLIWSGLMRSPQPLTAIELPPDANRTVAGWLALGKIGRTAWQKPYQFSTRVRDWQKQYPHHPANGLFVEQLLQAHKKRTAWPANVAVILPLSGQTGGRAAAVRDGLLAAQYASDGKDSHRAAGYTIRFYDTGGTPAGAVEAYQKAVAKGARAVIGPLHQKALASLADHGSISVPTLALADLPRRHDDTPAGELATGNVLLGPRRPRHREPQDAHPNLYQFGYLATDEARQTAERVVRDGRERGVALIPDTPQAHRMIRAFRGELETLGGKLLRVQSYKPGENSVATQIKRLFNLNLSRARKATLQSTIHRKLEFIPRRRRDVQFVFLIADNGEARLIRPQIRYHHGIGLPVYATSRIFAPGSNGEFDLNGVMFMELPWVLSEGGPAAGARKRIEHLWPARADALARFYALGYDAWRLAPLITHFDNPLSTPVRSATGVLSMGSGQRIHRHYDWAKYRRGKIEPLAKIGKGNQQ